MFRYDPNLMYVGQNLPIDTDNMVFWLNDMYEKTNNIDECYYIKIVKVVDYIVEEIVEFERVY